MTLERWNSWLDEQVDLLTNGGQNANTNGNNAYNYSTTASNSNIIKSISKRNLIGPDTVRRSREDSVEKDKAKELSKNGSVHNNANNSKEEDLFLWEISQSFSSIWNHPISRYANSVSYVASEIQQTRLLQ